MLNCKRHAELREGKYMISDKNKDVQIKCLFIWKTVKDVKDVLLFLLDYIWQ